MVLVPDDVQDMRDKRVLGNSIAPKYDPLVVIYDRSLSRSFGSASQSPFINVEARLWEPELRKFMEAWRFQMPSGVGPGPSVPVLTWSY